MHRFFHILGRPGKPAVWFMSESGAVGSWQARIYVELPIISSGFETAAGVRGLTVQEIVEEYIFLTIVNEIIIIIFYFDNVAFFHAEPRVRCLPQGRQLFEEYIPLRR